MVRKENENTFWGLVKKVIKGFVETVDRMDKTGKKEEHGVGAIEGLFGKKGLNAVYEYNIKLGLDNVLESIRIKRKKRLKA